MSGTLCLRSVPVAWLNWRLKAPPKAALMFAGPNCGLRVNPRGVVQRNGIRWRPRIDRTAPGAAGKRACDRR